MCKTIVVASPKGRVGKPTTAIARPAFALTRLCAGRKKRTFAGYGFAREGLHGIRKGNLAADRTA